MKPHLKKTWCLSKLDRQFFARLEQLLHLYSLPYDSAYPVLCFDERPCYLIGETMTPLAPQPGQVAKEHDADTKPRSCCLLAAIEPLTAKRWAQLPPRRTKRESALFLQYLAHAYPQATKIRLVQDNLNTHDISALYETFAPEQAFALAQRFEFYYTPKSASWLNMIEIEFSAVARQCLKRRIPTHAQMECEILALLREREQKPIKINWQFSVQAARDKFQRHYPEINENTRPLS